MPEQHLLFALLSLQQELITPTDLLIVRCDWARRINVLRPN